MRKLVSLGTKTLGLVLVAGVLAHAGLQGNEAGITGDLTVENSSGQDVIVHIDGMEKGLLRAGFSDTWNVGCPSNHNCQLVAEGQDPDHPLTFRKTATQHLNDAVWQLFTSGSSTLRSADAGD
jgi:hypothetical protein